MALPLSAGNLKPVAGLSIFSPNRKKKPDIAGKQKYFVPCVPWKLPCRGTPGSSYFHAALDCPGVLAQKVLEWLNIKHEKHLLSPSSTVRPNTVHVYPIYLHLGEEVCDLVQCRYGETRW